MSTTDNTPEDPRSAYHTTRFQLSAAVLIVVFLFVAGMSIKFYLDDPKPTDTTAAACERPASTDTRLTGPIPYHGTHNYGFVSYPATVFGPDRIEDNVPTCYEHSPAGAAVAAATMATLGDNGHAVMLLEELSTDTAARDAALDATPSETVRRPEVSWPAAVGVRDYTGDTATVTVVLDAYGRYAAADYRLVWEDNTWLWQVPTEPLHGYSVNSLSGYNQFQYTAQEAPRG